MSYTYLSTKKRKNKEKKYRKTILKMKSKRLTDQTTK